MEKSLSGLEQPLVSMEQSLSGIEQQLGGRATSGIEQLKILIISFSLPQVPPHMATSSALLATLHFIW